MGNAGPLDQLKANAILARLGVMAGGLGIDPTQLRTPTVPLMEALDHAGRIWLDADFRRIGLRTYEPQPPAMVRAGRAEVELETDPDGPKAVTTLWLSGPVPLAEDLAALAANGIPRTVVDDLGGKLRALGATRSIELGFGTLPDGLPWLVGVELGADSVQPVSVLAEALGVAPYQVALLGQVHPDLAANGCIVTVAVTEVAIRPELAIEYRDVTWQSAIATTNRLRRIDASKPYGVLAGAFSADRAAALEITVRADQLARVRVAVQYDDASEVS